MKNIIFRPYQKEAIKAIKDNWKVGIKSQLIVCPGGSGKRIMACHIASKDVFKKTLFIAHRKELIEQAYDELSAIFPLQCGIIKAERFEIDKKIVIASAQTLHRRLDKINKNTFDLIIVDEAHHFSSVTFRKPLDYFNYKLLTGWSATPTRMDNLSLSNIFDKIVYQYPMYKAIEKEYLCELDAYRIKTMIDISKIRKVAGDFNQKQLTLKVNTYARNCLIAKNHIQKGQGRQGIVYAVGIDHAYDIKKVFDEFKINSEVIVSDKTLCPNRDELIMKFKQNKINTLINCEIITEGFDYCNVGIIHMGRPTQSHALYIQTSCRGTRLKSLDYIKKFSDIDIFEYAKKLNININKLIRKKDEIEFIKTRNEIENITENENIFLKNIRKYNKCIILDYVDNTGNHKIINSYQLDKKKSIEEKTFVTKEKKKLLTEEKEKRERMLKCHYKDTIRVDLFTLPKAYISTSIKMKEPATEGQIEWLMRQGVYVEGNSYTKKQASEFITNFSATDNQIYTLAKWGYDVSNGVTVGEAKLAFEEIKEKHSKKKSVNEKHKKPMEFF